MGSYLSIVNNTDYDWYCSLGPDQAALSVSKYIALGIASVSLIIGSAGMAAVPVLASNGAITVAGVSASAISATTSVASLSATASLFTASVTGGLEASLSNDGYVHIRPGESHRFGKMTLSLWQQGTCVSTYILSNTEVQTKTVYMRPIFSGSTINSNRNHDIQYWLQHGKVETTNIVAEVEQNETVSQHT